MSQQALIVRGRFRSKIIKALVEAFFSGVVIILWARR